VHVQDAGRWCDRRCSESHRAGRPWW